VGGGGGESEQNHTHQPGIYSICIYFIYVGYFYHGWAALTFHCALHHENVKNSTLFCLHWNELSTPHREERLREESEMTIIAVTCRGCWGSRANAKERYKPGLYTYASP
jgi:hypothetical protein